MLKNIRRHRYTTSIAIIIMVVLILKIFGQIDLLQWLKDVVDVALTLSAVISSILHLFSRDPKQLKSKTKTKKS